MLVDRGWRGRGTGSALVQATVEWTRGQGLHKLCLEVFAHKCGRDDGQLAVLRILADRRSLGEDHIRMICQLYGRVSEPDTFAQASAGLPIPERTAGAVIRARSGQPPRTHSARPRCG